MGRGSKTKEADVKKQRPQHSKGTGGVGGDGKESDVTDSCLISFSETIDVSENHAIGIEVNSVVVITLHPSDPSQLQIYVHGKDVGLYTGKHSKKILLCINKNYTYEGVVTKVSKISKGIHVTYKLEGWK